MKEKIINPEVYVKELLKQIYETNGGHVYSDELIENVFKLALEQSNKCDTQILIADVLSWVYREVKRSNIWSSRKSSKVRFGWRLSYGLKHRCEDFFKSLYDDPSLYCSNEMIKCALVLLGFEVQLTSDTSVINNYKIQPMSEEQILDTIKAGNKNYIYRFKE